MELPNDVTAEQFLEAVRQGVCDAMLQMAGGADKRPDFHKAIKDGVYNAVWHSMPWAHEITDAIKEAHYRGR